INKTILVPTYEEKYDTTALRIYRENLPGYNVVGINCNSIISSLGALHCITKLVGVNEPLLIAHARLRDSDEPENQYPVHATIKHHSGINEANLFYRLSGDSVYTMVPMVITDSLSDEWTSIIPAYPSGSEVQYYIQAKSNSGKEQVRPIVAPDGYFKFKIYGEPVNQPPVVNIIQPLDGSVFEIEEDSTDIEIGAIDVDGEIVEGVLFINGDSITTFDTIPYIYHWTFPGEGEYQIFASVTDDKGAETISEEVQVTIENTTSNNSVSKTNLHVYPNPVEDILWIENTTAGLKDISITNIYGQKLTLPVLLQEDLFGYDFSGIQPGVYFLSTIIERINTTICVVKM
ncbi:MAG TPA: agmatine deiminase family protein, partial [Saprospiraceae bacterium]|nr:agmatine deiminase family protein [Saprospiraceae bacterium]